MSESDVCILNLRERCPKEAEECEFKHEDPSKASEATEETATTSEAAAPVVAKKVKQNSNSSCKQTAQRYFTNFLRILKFSLS